MPSPKPEVFQCFGFLFAESDDEYAESNEAREANSRRDKAKEHVGVPAGFSTGPGVRGGRLLRLLSRRVPGVVPGTPLRNSRSRLEFALEPEDPLVHAIINAGTGVSKRIPTHTVLKLLPRAVLEDPRRTERPLFGLVHPLRSTKLPAVFSDLHRTSVVIDAPTDFRR